MINILIADEKEKIKDMITQLLDSSGLVNLQITKKENMVRIIKKDESPDTLDLSAKIIELENSLYNEKKGLLYKSILDIIEKPLFERTLQRAEGNQLKAAKILGLNRNTVRQKIKRLGINPKIYKHY